MEECMEATNNELDPNFLWPDPKPEDLKTEDFNSIWNCIKTWDINVPKAYSGYCGATGNHVMAILFAIGKRNVDDYNMAAKPRKEGE